MAKKAKKESVKKVKVKKSAAAVTEKTKRGGGFVFALVSLLSALLVIAAVLCGFLFLIVKFNLLGVADTYREPIEKVPVLRLALPAPEGEEPAEMTLEELTVRYNSVVGENERLNTEIDTANNRIDELSRAKSEYDAKALINDEKTAQLEQKVIELEANKKQLDDMKYDLERAAANGDKEAFAKYFESVSPEVAQEIYAQIMQQDKTDADKQKFIKLFQTLDTKTSAQIIETLGSSRIDFITETLAALKRDVAADIISNLQPDLAAQVTLRLSGN